MSRVTAKKNRSRNEPEPAWDIAYLFPPQGQWTEEEYLALDGNRLVEFSDGVLEVLPMPTTSHQLLTAYLYGLLLTFVTDRDLGLVLFASLRIRLWPGKFREPDIVFMGKDHIARIGDRFWKGADLVMEIVSEDNESRYRDLKEKRSDYARGKIPEYWIVDPAKKLVTVLRLAGKRYVVHGEFTKGMTAASHLLPGFTVNVAELLAQQLSDLKKAGRAKRPRS